MKLDRSTCDITASPAVREPCHVRACVAGTAQSIRTVHSKVNIPIILLVTLLMLFIGTSRVFAAPEAATAANNQSAPTELPELVVAGVPFNIGMIDLVPEGSTYKITILQNDKAVFTRAGIITRQSLKASVPLSGRFVLRVETGGNIYQKTGRALPGITTVLPPLLAILMALIFRQVVVALFAGVWLGAFFVKDFHLFRSFYYVLDHYIVDSLAGQSGVDHISIAIFTLLLGGMVGIFSRMGATQGIVDRISRIATNPRRGQIASWLMGIFIFFDDYTNTLIVGNTMRPLTDKLRISREKLSYIVDSTAAPVTCIAIISSWIGFEISLIKDAFNALGLERNPFTTFVSSIRFSFYPILTLFFGLMIAATRRDYGPMLKAERRARETGKVLSDKAVPISNIDTELSMAENVPKRWFNAVIPIAVVVIGTVLGLIITGRSSLIAEGKTSFALMDVFRESNSFTALLWSSMTGCVVAIFLAITQRLLSLTEAINAWVAGIKSMMPAIIILVLAWSIGSVCQDLHTADYLVSEISGLVSPKLFPALIFLAAALISFSTGTSWGTMTILTPITVPLAFKILEMSSLDPVSQNSILLSSIAAILAGSVFGDHCSPISDTTIMSSMASAADHVDHVRTQLPYALTVALISMILGYLPTAYGMPVAASFLAAAIVIVGTIMIIGKKDTSYE